MEYKKFAKFLDKTTIQSCKFRTTGCGEINYNTCSSKIKFETVTLQPRLWDYCYAFLLAKRSISITWKEVDAEGKRHKYF